MYSSVKFFEPTVIVTLPFAGLDWIRLSELEAPVSVVLLLLPHAAIATARNAASTSVNAARSRRPLINPYPLSSIWTVRPAEPMARILCGAGGALQLYTPRRHEPLHARQRCLDESGE